MSRILRVVTSVCARLVEGRSRRPCGPPSVVAETLHDRSAVSELRFCPTGRSERLAMRPRRCELRPRGRSSLPSAEPRGDDVRCGSVVPMSVGAPRFQPSQRVAVKLAVSLWKWRWKSLWIACGMRHRASVIALLAIGFSSAGCGAVYPELCTKVREVPRGAKLGPRPPDDLLFLAFEGARIPQRTRDGRSWDRFGGSAPDPFAVLRVNDKQLFATPTQTNTLSPRWPDQPRGNYRVARGASVRVELWDANPINNHPICISKIRDLHDHAASGRLEIDCDSGARLSLIVEPAHGLVGLGLYYELRTDAVYVTRVIRESAAGRAGLRKGVELLKIQGRPVQELDSDEVRSLINANATVGLELSVRFPDGTVREVTLREDILYPAIDEDVQVE